MNEIKNIKQMEREIKNLKYLIIFLLIIVAILTIFLIGEYVGIWGGVFIEDPNNQGLPLTRIIDLYVIVGGYF